MQTRPRPTVAVIQNDLLYWDLRIGNGWHSALSTTLSGWKRSKVNPLDLSLSRSPFSVSTQIHILLQTWHEFIQALSACRVVIRGKSNPPRHGRDACW